MNTVTTWHEFKHWDVAHVFDNQILTLILTETAYRQMNVSNQLRIKFLMRSKSQSILCAGIDRWNSARTGVECVFNT